MMSLPVMDSTLRPRQHTPLAAPSPLDSTTHYSSQQAGDTHPTGMLSCLNRVAQEQKVAY